MYQRILVPLEHSEYDDAVMAHVVLLANHCGASVVLIHVADGWAARNQHQLDLRESDEMKTDREYLETRCDTLEARGIAAECVLAGGDPGAEIAAAAERERCDLVAMSTHGHKGMQDLLRGSVANEVRHRTTIPVLMVRGERRKLKPA
ncbi:MAG: universal stress protein [Gemmatimonadaceae bacterium]|nr:universal stress protein [Gemmatimonadaceae bacterium]